MLYIRLNGKTISIKANSTDTGLDLRNKFKNKLKSSQQDLYLFFRCWIIWDSDQLWLHNIHHESQISWATREKGGGIGPKLEWPSPMSKDSNEKRLLNGWSLSETEHALSLPDKGTKEAACFIAQELDWCWRDIVIYEIMRETFWSNCTRGA